MLDFVERATERQTLKPEAAAAAFEGQRKAKPLTVLLNTAAAWLRELPADVQPVLGFAYHTEILSKRLDALSKRSRRSKSFLAAEAIATYVESEEWQLGELYAVSPS